MADNLDNRALLTQTYCQQQYINTNVQEKNFIVVRCIELGASWATRHDNNKNPRIICVYWGGKTVTILQTNESLMSNIHLFVA